MSMHLPPIFITTAPRYADSRFLRCISSHRHQEFVTLLESYGLEPTSDLSQQLDEYLNDHPHIAVDMVAVQVQAALAVVRCQPVEPYTADRRAGRGGFGQGRTASREAVGKTPRALCR
jgi:hypothetical protein